METHRRQLSDAINGARILVIGAAGAIGGVFATQVAAFAPAALHLVDLSENGLAEIVRDLRSAGTAVADLRTFAIDLRNTEFSAFLAAAPGYDYVLNFSALKHVRAERDPFTLTRLIDTNVLAVDRLLGTLDARPPKGFFSISTDKSVRPTSLMGASKAMMEQVMWRHADRYTVSTSRFANVAFSAGSLLEGFIHRLAKRQPLAAPTDVRRYFISHEEAGNLCLLAAFLGRTREVFVPGFDDQGLAMTFSAIAEAVLEHHGYRPRPCASEDEARALAAELHDGSTEWPCWFTTSDTSGEKDIEEFFEDHDSVDLSRFQAVSVVAARPLPADAVARAVDQLDALRLGHTSDLARITAVLAEALPDLQHRNTGRDLDSKM